MITPEEIEPEEETETEPVELRAILIKESAQLDYCRCSRYCGDTSREIIEEITASTIEELIDNAAQMIPIYCNSSKDDAEPSLYLISTELSEQVREAFAVRVKAKEAKDAEEKAREETRKKEAAVRSKIRSLETRLAEIESGEEERRLRTELASAQETEK